MIKEFKGRLLTALKSFVSKLITFVKAPKLELQKDIQNMIASSVFVVGVAILAGTTKIILTDINGSDMGLSTLLLGSRTGESISLGIGLNLLHYILIGSTLLLSGIMFFLKNTSVLSSFQQAVLTQVQKIRNKKLLTNPTKNVKSIGSKKLKTTTSKTAVKFKQATSSVKLKPSPYLQSVNRFKTKMTSGLSRVLHSLTIYITKKRKQTIIVSVIAASAILNVFFLTTISAQFFTKNNIYSYGSVQIQTETAGLNVYRDSSCTNKVSSLPWGNISPGGSISNLVYIKNEGDVPLTLTLDTTDWSPSNAPNYISLNWNYDGQAIEPNQVILVRLTLRVSQSINGIQSFDFQIIINGTG